MKRHLPVVSAILWAGLGLLRASTIGVTGEDPKYSVTATNKTGMTVFDFEIRFIGSGGMVTNPSFVKNDGPGDAAIKVSASGDGVDIAWGAINGKGLDNTKSVSFTFDNPNKDLTLSRATWTDLGMKGSGKTADAANDTKVSVVPEPATGGLLGAAFVAIWLAVRRRLSADR